MEWPCCVRLPHGKLRQGLQYAGGKIYSDICSKYDLKYFRKIYSRVLRQIWFQDSAEKEGQPEILSETVHNLAKSSQTGFYIISIITILIMITSSTSSGGLWLLDNESGLFDAYTLLFPSQEMGPAAQNEALRWQWHIWKSNIKYLNILYEIWSVKYEISNALNIKIWNIEIPNMKYSV